jgi:hypothetical protein
MTNSAPWPTNEYGTPWRRASLCFDWQDEDVLDEAIESINPLMITVQYHSVAVIGFDNDGDIVGHYIADTLPPPRKFDSEGMCAVIDPCADPAALQALVEEKMDTVRFSVFGVGVLDLADEATHRALLAALSDRCERFVGEMPCIDF